VEYRHLGRAGLEVSVLSFGSWVTFGPQLDEGLAADCLAAAYDAGVNFFDNAESYAGGESERIMGAALKRLGWPRYSYVVSTKLFWGIHDVPNMKNTLNRKYLMQAIDASLDRFGLDFVDLLFCHRPDPDTPIEETVETMSDIVAAGKALYWGTSEWKAADIRAAWEIADRHHLRKPVMEQPQYNLVFHQNVEQELAPVCDELGIGLTTWSPLASGLLSGKYAGGIPEGSRAALPGYDWVKSLATDPGVASKIEKLRSIATELDCTLSQLAIAWCTKNPHVSTVITGASRVDQVRENMGALEVAERLEDPVLARIREAVA